MIENESEAKSLPWTGERYLPEITGSIALEHLHRYVMARELAAGKTVLDIACGEGYGSAYLAEVANQVFGVDVSDDAIQHASHKYKRNNLEFKVGSCAQIPLSDRSIDLIVSFETIEHHDQHDAMMAEIKRVLRPEGMIIISSPEKDAYSVTSHYSNPFHVKELSRCEFEDLMAMYFRYVSMYGQRVIYGSGILREKSSGPIVTFEGVDGSPPSAPGMRRPIYLIAVASDIELPISSSSVFEQRISKSEEVLERDRIILERDRIILERDRIISESDAQIFTLNNQLQAILSSWSWRVTAPLRDFCMSVFRVMRAVYWGLPLRDDRKRFLKYMAYRYFGFLIKNIGSYNHSAVVPPSGIVKKLASISSFMPRPLRVVQRKRLQSTEIESSGLFDDEWYLTQNPDVSVSGMEALEHYISRGAAEGRSPNPLFNPSLYIEAHKGCAGFQDALLHFHHSDLLVAPGAYRTPDVLISVQHHYRRNTDMHFLRDQRSSDARFVVYLQCGSGSVHKQWLKGNNRSWDLIVNHYDDSYVGSIPCEVEFQQVGIQPGTKFTSFLALLCAHEQLIKKYEYFLLLDDDICIEEAGITHLFEAAEQNRLDLAQASLTPDSYCAHPICKNSGGNGLRYVSAAEIMMPVISRKAIHVGAHLFAQTISGWGLDVALGKLISDRYRGRAAIVDSVMARHTKAIDTQGGAFYRMLHQANVYPEIELTHIQKMHKAGHEINEIGLVL